MTSRTVMNWGKFVPGLNTTSEEFLRKNAHLPAAEIALLFGRHGIYPTYNSIQNKRKSLGLGNVRAIIKESPYVRYDSPWEVEGDQLYISDVEFPYHNAAFLNRVLDLAYAWKIREINIAGDMLLLDSLSPFGRNWKATHQKERKENALSLTQLEELQKLQEKMKDKKDSEAIKDYLNSVEIDWKESDGDVSEEWEQAGKCLRSMKDVFIHARCVVGNHEGRLLQVLQSPLSPQALLDVLRVNEDGKPWMEISPYYYMLHRHERGMLRISHPKNFGAPAGPAAVMADKYQMDFAMGHGHRWGMIQSRSGKYVGIEMGCCVDPLRPAYHAQRDSTAWEWTPGAMIVRGGYYYLLHNTQTNWEKLKRS